VLQNWPKYYHFDNLNNHKQGIQGEDIEINPLLQSLFADEVEEQQLSTA